MVNLKIKIPDTFLKEEVRCDYKITREMKELWAIELDLYMELKRVCNKFNLKFAADSGTLLGAIRHNGFIPWDDDMDFSMPREDYEKLCEIAPKEFAPPYYF
ncbi:MAG: LicD family protein, partial [Prevotella sp.]|nr:LicD family protein [Prevotella sp.]